VSDAHALCCVELIQESLAHLPEAGLEAPATSFAGKSGKFTGGAYEGLSIFQ